MSNQIEYAGSLYTTMRDAANRWAETALPDTRVIGRKEAAEEAARGLESFWWNEAQKSGEGAPEDTDEEDWREACRDALVRRIDRSRERT